MTPATAAAAGGLAVLVGVSALASPLLLAAAAGVVVLCVALGWPRLLRLPSPRGSRATLAATGLVALAVVLLVDASPPLAPVAGVVAIGVLGEFLHQMLRRDGRPRLVESVTGTVAGQALLLMVTGWVVLPDAVRRGGEVVVVGVLALLGALLGCALPLPPRLQWVLALPLATTAGALAGFWLSPLSALESGVLGLAVGVSTSAVHSLLGAQPPARTGSAVLAVAAGPVAASGLAAYVAARLLAG